MDPFLSGLLMGAVSTLCICVLLLFHWHPFARSNHTSRQQINLRRRTWRRQEANGTNQMLITGGNSESTTWVTLIIHQLASHVSQLISGTDGIALEVIVNEKLKNIKWPPFIQPVMVTDIQLGTSFPSLKHVQVISYTPGEPLELELCVHCISDAHICIDTSIQIHQPVPNFASLPIEAGIANIEFDFKLLVTITPTPTGHRLAFSLHPSYAFDFDLHTDIGYQLTLSNIPHFKDILVKVITEVLESKLVTPKEVTIQMDVLDDAVRTMMLQHSAASTAAAAAAAAAASNNASVPSSTSSIPTNTGISTVPESIGSSSSSSSSAADSSTSLPTTSSLTQRRTVTVPT